MLIDFAIVTALEKERQAVCEAFGLTDSAKVRKQSRVYWRGRLPLKDGYFYELVVAQAPDMANVDAALLTNDTVHHWDPDALLLVGIAGAASDDVALGDVVLARDIYYYERGKVTSGAQKPEPVMYRADATLWNNVTSVPPWLDPIPVQRPDATKERPHIHGGVIASGEKVIAEAAARDQIAASHRKILAIEMEGYGFSSAVWQSFDHHRHLVIRAICDRADRNKSEDWQPYAAAAAAGFARHFLLDQPLSPRNNPTELNKEVTPIRPHVTKGFEWDVFISYSRKDEEMAARIQRALAERGLQVWRDVDQVRPGEIFAKSIERGLEKSSSVAILISPDSMASGWVEEEYYRVLSLTKRPDKPAQLIPVLLRNAELPGFLASRAWVDFRDPSPFDQSLESLVQAILGRVLEPGPVSALGDAVPGVDSSAIRFLWFFPEGLLRPIFRRLVLQVELERVVEQAEQKRFISIVEYDGVQLVGVATEHVRELRSCIGDEPEEARKLFELLTQCYAEENPFEYVDQLGIGRALLLRDQLSLARYLRPEDEDEGRKQLVVCQLARSLLPKIMEEKLLRIGLEISTMLLALTDSTAPADYLTYARLLLGVGEAERAMGIFETYRGEDLFAEAGLDDLGRLNAAVDWAKAAKDAGRAGPLHSELIRAYGQMLDLVRRIESGSEKPALLELERADILNNRATQLAEIGGESDWAQAQRDLKAAAEIYTQLGDRRSLIKCRANFAALVLDTRQASGNEAALDEQIRALASLDEDAKQIPPGEDLFFYFYQRGRLLRRRHPAEPDRAVEMYEKASQVAQEADLSYQSAMARRWVLRLRQQAGLISENDYLEGLRECANSLRKYTENAWAEHSLRDTLIDIARVLHNRKEISGAWATLVEAFGVQAHRFERSRSGVAEEHLVRILSLMHKLPVQEDQRTLFVNNQRLTLGLILRVPSWQPLHWEEIMDWVEKREEMR